MKLNALISQPLALERHLDKIIVVVQDFIGKYDVIDSKAKAVNMQERTADEIRPLIQAIKQSIPSAESNLNVEVENLYQFVKVFKILLRKQVNRVNLNKTGVIVIVQLLKYGNSINHNMLRAELCNIVLNMCYEPANIRFFLDENGLILLLSNISSRDGRLLTR